MKPDIDVRNSSGNFPQYSSQIKILTTIHNQFRGLLSNKNRNSHSKG